MTGRHLRRGRARMFRHLLAVVGVLLLGAAIGGGGSLLLDERGEQVGSEAADGAGAGGAALLRPEPGPITIALAGDVTAGGALALRLASDPDGFVGPVTEVLRTADLAVVNLDAPIVADPAGGGGEPAAPVGILAALAGAGVDVVSVANDRSLALGAEGLAAARTGDAVAIVGHGADEAAAYRPFVRDVGGHTLAVLAATQVLEPDRIGSDTAGPEQPGVASAKRVDRLVAEVEAARLVADTVVVYVHWGAPGDTCPSASQQELAAALVAAGADVVAGPGAGRVLGAGRLGGSAVAYGLGAFLVDDQLEVESGVLLIQVDGRAVLGIEWVPARRTDGVPLPLEGAEADAASAEWASRRDCTDLTP